MMSRGFGEDMLGGESISNFGVPGDQTDAHVAQVGLHRRARAFRVVGGVAQPELTEARRLGLGHRARERGTQETGRPIFQELGNLVSPKRRSRLW